MSYFTVSDPQITSTWLRVYSQVTRTRSFYVIMSSCKGVSRDNHLVAGVGLPRGLELAGKAKGHEIRVSGICNSPENSSYNKDVLSSRVARLNLYS